MSNKTGAKGQKIGRHGRRPGAATQKQRTERNKARNIKRAAAAAATKKTMKVPRGSTRAERRRWRRASGMTRVWPERPAAAV